MINTYVIESVFAAEVDVANTEFDKKPSFALVNQMMSLLERYSDAISNGQRFSRDTIQLVMELRNRLMSKD